MKTIALPDRPRILLVKLSAIGDVIHAMPVACALRDAFPQAFLAWLVEGRAGELLEGHPAIDALIRLPRGWLRSPRQVWTLRQRLRSERFDIAIDAQGLSKSGVAAWLSGARWRIGFRGPDGRELSPLLTNVGVRPTAHHVVDRNLELLGPLGLVHPPAHFDLAISHAESVWATDVLKRSGLDERFAVVNPGAGWPSKLWPPERFARVAHHLARSHGLTPLVVWAGDAERRMAETIVARAECGAVLAPRTSLRELASLLARARLFVGSDTGPLHLAAAIGVPSVGLLGPMPGSRNGPYGQGHRTVQVLPPDEIPRQLKRTCPRAMLAIEVDHVTKACDELLAQPPARCLAVPGVP